MLITKTQDLLQQVQIPNSSGYGSYLDNFGDINSKGVEAALNVIADKNDFKIELGGNISVNRTTVGDLGVPEADFYDGELINEQYIFGNSITSGYQLKGPSNVFIKGQQIALLYGYEVDGIYQSHKLRQVDQLSKVIQIKVEMFVM